MTVGQAEEKSAMMLDQPNQPG